MNRRATLVVLSAALLVAPSVAAQALPCADAYAASAEGLISSLHVADMPEGSATVMELMVRLSVFSVNRGNSSAALTLLQVAENILDRDLRRGRVDEVTAESLRAQIEQLRAVLANCTATPQLLTFNCRSGDGENELFWMTPPGTHTATKILFRTDTYPQGPFDPAASLVGSAPFPGAPDSMEQATHGSLANDVRYYYAAYAVDASGDFSPAKYTFGRPQSRTGSFRWSYTANGTGSPSIGGFAASFMTASSTAFVFALEPTADGGLWTAGYTPATVPSPSSGRPISLPGVLTPDGEPWVLVTSLEGRVWAINEITGATEWTSPDLGDPIETSVCAMFTPRGVDDVVMVGTVNRFGRSRFVGLDLADGSVAWTFDNGGSRNGIGPIRHQCSVDYGRQRVYFTSESTQRGSPDTVWALELGSGSATKLWSAIHPDVNTAVVMVEDTLYVGTDLGDVLAIDVADGSSRWSSPYSTGDGPVESFVFPDWRQDRLAFSTSNQVHLIRDNGSGATSLWTEVVLMPEPNAPLVIGDTVFVADAEGGVYSLNAAGDSPDPEPFVTVGDPSRRTPPGLSYFNGSTGLYGFGTAEGVLHVVEAP